ESQENEENDGDESSSVPGRALRDLARSHDEAGAGARLAERARREDHGESDHDERERVGDPAEEPLRPDVLDEDRLRDADEDPARIRKRKAAQVTDDGRT